MSKLFYTFVLVINHILYIIMEKLFYYLSALLMFSAMVSCEGLQEIEPLQEETKTSVITTSNVGDSGPTYFILDIESNGVEDCKVGIVDKLSGKKKVTIVTQKMCPYIYYYEIPDGKTPEVDDIEVIATNSCMQHIAGFRDDFGSYAHSQTYLYAVFWQGTTHITAVFERDFRSYPLPEGVDESSSTEDMKRTVDVDIAMQRMGNMFSIKAQYFDFDNCLQNCDIISFHTLSVLAGTTLQIEVSSNSDYGGQLFFQLNNGEPRTVKISSKWAETIDYQIPKDSDGIRIDIY